LRRGMTAASVTAAPGPRATLLLMLVGRAPAVHVAAPAHAVAAARCVSEAVPPDVVCDQGADGCVGLLGRHDASSRPPPRSVMVMTARPSGWSFFDTGAPMSRCGPSRNSGVSLSMSS
jgi:hypothetical protein